MSKYTASLCLKHLWLNTPASVCKNAFLFYLNFVGAAIKIKRWKGDKCIKRNKRLFCLLLFFFFYEFFFVLRKIFWVILEKTWWCLLWLEKVLVLRIVCFIGFNPLVNYVSFPDASRVFAFIILKSINKGF